MQLSGDLMTGYSSRCRGASNGRIQTIAQPWLCHLGTPRCVPFKWSVDGLDRVQRVCRATSNGRRTSGCRRRGRGDEAYVTFTRPDRRFRGSITNSTRSSFVPANRRIHCQRSNSISARATFSEWVHPARSVCPRGSSFPKRTIRRTSTTAAFVRGTIRVQPSDSRRAQRVRFFDRPTNRSRKSWHVGTITSVVAWSISRFAFVCPTATAIDFDFGFSFGLGSCFATSHEWCTDVAAEQQQQPCHALQWLRSTSSTSDGCIWPSTDERPES